MICARQYYHIKILPLLYYHIRNYLYNNYSSLTNLNTYLYNYNIKKILKKNIIKYPIRRYKLHPFL